MKEIVFDISIGINVVVLLAIIWLVSGGLASILKRYLLYPLYQRWTTQFDLFKVASTDSVFLGDSITEGGKWNELFPDRDVRNRGILGDTTSGVLARLNQILNGKPHQIFLLIGTNDLAIGISESEIIKNILKIISQIQNESPSTQVFVQSVLPRHARYQLKVESFNQHLAERIPKNVDWINLYPLFLNKEGVAIDPQWSNDSLHLLGSGYIVWRKAIVDLVGKANGQHLDRPEWG